MIIQDNIFIREYLKCVKTGDEVGQCILLNSILKKSPTKLEVEAGIKYEDMRGYSTCEIEETGLLDFKFTHRRYAILNGKLKSRFGRIGIFYL